MSVMDWVIRNGTLVTMDSARRVLKGDLAIRAGVIAGVGDGVASAAHGTSVDATGCFVMPGFVQAHVHLCQTLFRGLADDLPLLGWLRDRIWPLEAAHDPASLRASARLGLAEMLLAGTTTILDMGTVHHHEVVMEELVASGMRGLSGKAMMDVGEGVPSRLLESAQRALDSSLELYRAFDGAADGRIGYAFAPRFILSCSEGLLRATSAAAEARGAIVHTHAAEHADERHAVREALGREDVDALAAFGITGPRAVLAHGVQLRPEEMQALAEVGTRVVHCPSANLKLSSGIADVVALRAAGVTVGLGSDGAACNNRMDPFTELREAALLASVKRGVAGALPAEEALAMATIDGARVLGLDDRTGSLEPGKRADVIVIRPGLHAGPGGSPAGRIAYACTPADVRHVWIDGERVVEDARLVRWDASTIMTEAETQMHQVLARAGLA